MTVPEKLSALRACMREEGIDAYLVPTDDFHGSEYVGSHFKCREYLTGFTGSAGTALVLSDSAYLWTDGRYFLQAGRQLAGSQITLMKIGQEKVPGIREFLAEHLTAGQTVGYDGRCMTYAKAKELHSELEKHQIHCKGCREDGPLDLVGQIWEDRPPLPCEKVWQLEEFYTGRSRQEKLSDLRAAMKKENCSRHIIASLDDIAYLLNLRGSDILYNPVFLSYLAVEADRADLYADRRAFPEEIEEALRQDGITLRPYEDIYRQVRQIPAGSRVLLDPASINDTLWTSMEHCVCVARPNPSILMKAVKNAVEMRHMREAHVKDGAAVCRFIYWLKEQMKHPDAAHPVTELSASEKLLSFRKEMEHFLEPSFETIASYGAHGAIIHYSPTAQSDIAVEPRGFLLVDSGGQYLEGTTDITRTIACGPLTGKEKEFYTRVLRGCLNLGAARFLYGCTGMAFDYLARQPLWEIGADYNHGTGHGVGFLLNVHEGPNSFSYKIMQGRPLPCVLEEGMITSDEPGIYFEGEFGVRCENLMLCVKDEKNAYGQFMHFDTLTMVPWELDAVVPDLLNEREKELLNAYHAKVYEQISPYLKGAEKEWLREATRAI